MAWKSKGFDSPRVHQNDTMKNYASKRPNKGGKAAYRTPSRFIYRKTLQIRKTKRAVRSWGLAKRLEYRHVRNK